MRDNEHFRLNSRFIATIYDVRFSNEPLDKKRFRDLYRSAFIINKLYSESKSTPSSKETLVLISEYINTMYVRFEGVEKLINSAFAEPQNELKETPVSDDIKIPYQWDNKMYLSLVQLLCLTDKATWRLKILNENKAIDKKLYYRLLKQAANPMRSVIDFILKPKT